MNVRATFGESGLNSGRIISLWPAGPVLHISFVRYLIAFCSRPQATNDVISGRFERSVISDKLVKFGDPHSLNLSQEIPHEAVCDGIFNVFFAVASDRK